MWDQLFRPAPPASTGCNLLKTALQCVVIGGGLISEQRTEFLTAVGCEGEFVAVVVADLVPKVPSSSSALYGQPFIEIFEAAGKDFYKIDPLLFSPAEIVIQNMDTGRVHHAGKVAPDILRKSFGL